ncbi:hypothetical protein FA95DRAFT_122010 [Auriscalpium vulgare]|uniref:Uncharacterized protein n=1 Tax=Auriscalpium vulgare TaxID=40419 RepID=A0ACB8RPS5_9AGAM|nr:hypothetical protein FA95DRAFT_122010 [Auriscalpium vulgare]
MLRQSAVLQSFTKADSLADKARACMRARRAGQTFFVMERRKRPQGIATQRLQPLLLLATMSTTLSASAATSSSFLSTLESRIPAAISSSITVLSYCVVPVLAACTGYKLTLLALRRYRQRWVNKWISLFTIAVNFVCAAVALRFILIGDFVKNALFMAASYVGCGMQVAIIVNDVRETRAQRVESELDQVPADGGEREQEIDDRVVEKGEKGEPSVMDTAGVV